jgi:hypothetical protein
MTDVSRIPDIVDASAYIAHLVTGVKAVWGVGCGVTLPAGFKVHAFPGQPAEDYTHVSDMPDAPSVKWISATVTEITWSIPMALFVSANDLGEARRRLAPFYGPYLTMFSQHTQLLGIVNSALLTAFRITEESGTWVALRMVLTAIERLNFSTAAG